MNRVLVVGPAGTGKVGIATGVFGISQRNVLPSLKGGVVIEDGSIATKYYTAKIGLFVDEVEASELESYLAEFQHNDMKDLRDALSGILLTVDSQLIESSLDSLSRQLNEISEQMDAECPEDKLQWDGFKAVYVKGGCPEEAEQRIIEAGFEVTDNLEMLRKAVESTIWKSYEPVRPDHSVKSLDSAIKSARSAREHVLGLDAQEQKEQYAQEVSKKIMKQL